MSAYELVLHEESGIGRRYRLSAQGLVIGRAVDADVKLGDQLVSRRHARVWDEGGQVWVEDLGSRNGILVNGETTAKSPLSEGDVLVIGGAEFKVARAASPQASQTMISFEEGVQLAEEITARGAAERLPILYKAARLLGSVFDPGALLNEILALLFEALPVRRGFVLTLDPATGDPAVRASQSRDGEGGGPPLSQTLIQHVMSERTAVLTVDAQEDSRFDGALSIMGHQIHAAMCAPLAGRDSVAGVLYADSGRTGAKFSQSDFELFTAIAHVVGVAVENTRLHREKVEQERLAAIGEATAGLGHCMRNILTGIKGGAEFVDMSIREKDVKYLERAWPIMSQAVQRIEMLVMNLLMYSRERTPERLSVSLDDVVQEVAETVRARAGKHNVAINLELAGNAVLRVDLQQIFRVVLNLLTNAVDACERDGGTVTVATRVSDGGCYIDVRDTGPGIPPEIRERLGQAFVSTKGSSGTGLGLAVSMKLVREHGGEIEIESTPGAGALFSVFLPRQAPESGAARPTDFSKR